MALQITLLKAPGNISVANKTHVFNEQGGTIGRGDKNTWVLPDPNKFLSSCHCEIKCIANQFYLVDLSTNGTFVNGSHEPLGRGNKSPMSEGDTFEIGDYRFSVKLMATDLFASQPSVSSPFASGDDIFGVNAPFMSGDKLANDSFGTGSPSANLFDDPFSVGGGISDFGLSPQGEIVDPLIALDKAQGNAVSKNQSIDSLLNLNSGFDEFDSFGAAKKTGAHSPIPDNFGDDIFTSAPMNVAPSIDQAISWPSANQENLIPDDWEDDLLGPAEPFAQKPLSAAPLVSVPQRPVVPAPQTLRERISSPSDDFMSDDPFAASAAPVTPLQPASAIAQPARPSAPTNLGATPVPPSVVPERQAYGHQTTTAPAPSAPATDNLNTGKALLDAMGLDSSRLSQDEIMEINVMTGVLMREIVDGMMQVLRSRTSIKNEFRMNVTTIQPVENNPLKFSVGVDEALENMFIRKSNAYKKPVDAFREGFQEIGEHQVAIIAGIRHGFDRMLERFNPATLEKNFDKQGKGGLLLGSAKAKYWSSYSEYYKNCVDNMDSSFQHLFGSDFVNAYEDQLRKLTASRRKNK